MRSVKTVILLVLLISLASAQYRETDRQSGIGIPYFKLAVHQKYNEDLEHTNVLIMTQFLNDDLTFIKNSFAGFDAEIELIFAIYDTKDNVVDSRVVNKTVHADSYEATNNRDIHFDLKETFKLKHGKYRVFVKSNDMNSHKTAQRKQEISVSDYSKKEIDISPILFVHAVDLDSSGQLLSFDPSFSNNFTVRAGKFYIYFDIYSADSSESLNLHYQLHHKKNKAEMDSSFSVRLPHKISSILIHIERNLLKHNQYTLEVTLQRGKLIARQSQVFTFYWSDTPSTGEDIVEALDQMSYILPNDSLRKYKDAELEAQKSFFTRFWKERDPDPTTEENELKSEYFTRVNYTNQHYKAMGIDGWKSDRGRIFIKFGPPDDVERHPFELDRKPFEIWRYYSLRKVFYFIDVTGFGDYRLHPDFLEVEFQ